MAGPSSSGAIELLALEGHVVFGVVVQDSRGLAKMPVYLSALVRTIEQDGATARAGVQGGHLVEGGDLAPGLEDATLGTPAHWSIHTFSLGTTWPCTLLVQFLQPQRFCPPSQETSS